MRYQHLEPTSDVRQTCIRCGKEDTYQYQGASQYGREPLVGCYDCLSKIPEVIREDGRAWKEKYHDAQMDVAYLKRELELARMGHADLLDLLRRERARLNYLSDDTTYSGAGYGCAWVGHHKSDEVQRSNIRQAIDAHAEARYEPGTDWVERMLRHGVSQRMEDLDEPEDIGGNAWYGPASAIYWKTPEGGEANPRCHRVEARDDGTYGLVADESADKPQVADADPAWVRDAAIPREERRRRRPRRKRPTPEALATSLDEAAADPEFGKEVEDTTKAFDCTVGDGLDEPNELTRQVLKDVQEGKNLLREPTGEDFEDSTVEMIQEEFRKKLRPKEESDG